MFSFKQFTIRQDRTAMKVCTDACVLGAYADVAGSGTDAPTRILDIGTGTGLLALMAAQRNRQATIDAVEMDEAAFGQATENVAASPFADRVRVWQGRIQEFPEPGRQSAGAGGGMYDRILTNPPFYTNHLRSPDSAVSRALHTDDLPFPELLDAVHRLLEPDGQWWVLLPPYETGLLTDLAGQSGLHPFRQVQLRHNERKPVFRLITGLSYNQQPVTTDTLDVYETDSNTYTAGFRALLRDFYLIF